MWTPRVLLAPGRKWPGRDSDGKARGSTCLRGARCETWLKSSASLCSVGALLKFRFVGRTKTYSGYCWYPGQKSRGTKNGASLVSLVYCLMLDKCLINFFLVRVQLIYNVLVSAVEQSESVIYIYIHSFRFPSFLGHQWVLSRALCAIQ